MADDAPPDRLSVDPKSSFFDEAALTRGVGIRFKGRERFDVEEYCVSEGWIRAPIGKTRDRKGQLLTVKMTGEVEAYKADAPGLIVGAAVGGPPSLTLRAFRTPRRHGERSEAIQALRD